MAAAVTTEPLRDGGRPPVPLGRRVELPQRGTTFVREVPGPPGAPTLLLLHGWVASGALNWFQVFEPLSEHFRLLAPDLRGHARGVRSSRVFRLADCADDCAEMLVATGTTGPVIAVGYSMGGPVAQLLWRRHRDLVAGLVLCATSAGFLPDHASRRVSQAWMLGWAAAARAGALARVPASVPSVVLPRSGSRTWAAAEMRRHDWRMILEAGHSLTTYHAGWIGEVDVPTAVVCTAEDRGVAPSLQLATAEAIRGATIHTVADGHLACAGPRFADPLRRACVDVAGRIH